MLDKLAAIHERYLGISQQITDPDVMQDMKAYIKLSKDYKELQPIIEGYKKYKVIVEGIEACRTILDEEKDEEMRAFAREEMESLVEQRDKLEEEIRLMLIPSDPQDVKNAVVEIRAGSGGDEASIFAGDLFRMYTRYVQPRGWKMEILSISDGPAGGVKEVIALVTGQGAFSRLKYERGVHRVQRVPETEQMGRIHTSTATVAVLPEAEDVEIDIQEKDLRIDVYRAGGPGGQSVNTTDSAVRMTHLPTGIVVAMQDEKSQHKNRDKALRVLKARLLEHKQSEQDKQRQDERRSQVGSGERAEKIRTYNYPQSRLTDHRIGLSLYNLQTVIDGDLDAVIDPLITHYQAEALKDGTSLGPKTGQ